MSKEEQGKLWDLLMYLAVEQYNKGKVGETSGDEFSTIVTPYHTDLLQLVSGIVINARIKDAHMWWKKAELSPDKSIPLIQLDLFRRELHDLGEQL